MNEERILELLENDIKIIRDLISNRDKLVPGLAKYQSEDMYMKNLAEIYLKLDKIQKHFRVLKDTNQFIGRFR